MFILFLMVLVAVTAVMANRWERAHVAALRMTGAASIALGLRVMALVTAFYLWPSWTQSLWSDEGDNSSPIATSQPDVTPATSEPAPSPAPVASVPAEQTTAEAPLVKSAPADEKVVESPLSKPQAVESSEAVSSSDSASAEARSAELPLNPADSFAKSTAREPVKFVTNVRYLTENRPAWIEKTPTEANEPATIAVRAGPYPTARDCQPDLEREVNLAVADFVNQQVKAKHASTFINYSMDELRRRSVIRELFNEQLETSLGLMNQVHARLVFDDAFRNEIDLRWSEIKSRSRLAQVGLGSGIMVLLLGTLFSYFRLDTATKGYYTRRLQFGTAGTILALVAASIVLAKWIPWM